jgi:hypothetical protein
MQMAGRATQTAAAQSQSTKTTVEQSQSAKVATNRRHEHTTGRVVTKKTEKKIDPHRKNEDFGAVTPGTMARERENLPLYIML